MNYIPNQEGRIIIVTGANTGLGYETTKALAQNGAKVIMACRNMLKAKKAKDQILEELPDARLEIIELDLSKLDSVRQFAEAYQTKFDRLDVLINNAGVMMPPYTETEDGFELQFMTNYLGHFLLTGLLLPLILKTPNARVVSLSSIAHKNGNINFDDLQSKKAYSASKAYGQSKLACLMYAYELQRRLDWNGHKDTLSTAAHPGIATTELARHMPTFLYSILRYTVAPFITHSPAKGAQPTIMAAVGKAEGGDYFGPTGFQEFKGKPGKVDSTPLSKDEDIAKRLWELSEQMVGMEYL